MIRLTMALMAAACASVLLMGTVQAQQAQQAQQPAPSAAMSDTTKAKPSERVKARKAMVERKTKKKPEPTMWDKTKDMTRKQWNSAKGAWSKEQDKWRVCNDKAKAEKLSGTKRWTSVGSCMTS